MLPNEVGFKTLPSNEPEQEGCQSAAFFLDHNSHSEPTSEQSNEVQSSEDSQSVLEEALNASSWLIDTTADIGLSPWIAPRPLKSTLRPVQPFTVDLVPKLLADFINDEASRMSTSPDFIATSLVTALSSVLGARTGMRPKTFDNWEVKPNIWGYVVAPPSSLKSPAISAGMKSLDRLVDDARETYQDELVEFKVASLVHETQESNLRDQLKQAGKKNDESVIAKIARQTLTHKQNAPKAPVLKRYKANDATPEALAVLEAANENGILGLYDELVALLAPLEQRGNEKHRTFIMEGFNGNSSIEIDRISREPVYIKNHCLSFFGGIQPDALVKYLKSSIEAVNDGLFQRFQLAVYPDPPAWKYRDSAPNSALQNQVYAMFQKIDALTDNELVLMGAICAEKDINRPYFRFSPEAQEIFKTWMIDLQLKVSSNEEHPIVGQHLAKYASLMPKLALLFHVIDCLETGKKGSVSLQAAKYSIAWCDYLETHARRIYHLVLDDKTSIAALLALKIKKEVKKHALQMKDTSYNWVIQGFNARHIQQKGWSGLSDIKVIHDTLEILVDEYWLQVQDISTAIRGGRPSSKLYRINPALYAA